MNRSELSPVANNEEYKRPEINAVVTNYDRVTSTEGELVGWDRSSKEYEQRGWRGAVQKIKYNFLRQDLMRRHVREAQKEVKKNSAALLLDSRDADAAVRGLSLTDKPYIDREEMQAYRESVGLDEKHEDRLDSSEYSAQQQLLEAQLQNLVERLVKHANRADRSHFDTEINAWVSNAISQLPQFYKEEDRGLIAQQISETVEQATTAYDAELASHNNSAEVAKINLMLAGMAKSGNKSKAAKLLAELGSHPVLWSGASIAFKAFVLAAPGVGGAFASARKWQSVKHDLNRMQKERTHGWQGREDGYRRDLAETFGAQIPAAQLAERMRNALAAVASKDLRSADPAQVDTLIGGIGALQAIAGSKYEAITYSKGEMQRERVQLLKLQSAAQLRLRQLYQDRDRELNGLISRARGEMTDQLDQHLRQQEKAQRKLKIKKAAQSGAITTGISLAGIGLAAAVPDEWTEAVVDKGKAVGKFAYAELKANSGPVEDAYNEASDYVQSWGINSASAAEQSPAIEDASDGQAPVDSEANPVLGDGTGGTEFDAPVPEAPESEPQSLWQQLVSQQDQRDQSNDQYITYGTPMEGEYNELELTYESSGDGEVVINVSGMEGNADGVGGEEFPEDEQLYAVFYLTDHDKEVGNEIRVPIPDDGRLVINEDTHPELLPLFETTDGQVDQQFAVLGIASENDDGSYTFYASNWDNDISPELIKEMQQVEVATDVPPPTDEDLDDNGNPIQEVGDAEEEDRPEEPAADDDEEEDAVVPPPIPSKREVFASPLGPGLTGDHRSQMASLKQDQEQPLIVPPRPTVTVHEVPQDDAQTQDQDNALGQPRPLALGPGQLPPGGPGSTLRQPGINQQGGVGNRPYGPDLRQPGINQQGGVGNEPYGPTLRQSGINQRGGVGNRPYGPDLPPILNNGINRYGGVGNESYGPTQPEKEQKQPAQTGAAQPEAGAAGTAASPSVNPSGEMPRAGGSINSENNTDNSGNIFQENSGPITLNNGVSGEQLLGMQAGQQAYELERQRLSDADRDRERQANLRQSEILVDATRTAIDAMAARSDQSVEELLAEVRDELRQANEVRDSNPAQAALLASIEANAQALKDMAELQRSTIDAINRVVEAAMNRPDVDLKPVYDLLLPLISERNKQFSDQLAQVLAGVRQADSPQLNVALTNVQQANSELRPNLRILSSQSFAELQRARRRAYPRRGRRPRVGRGDTGAGQPEPDAPEATPPVETSPEQPERPEPKQPRPMTDEERQRGRENSAAAMKEDFLHENSSYSFGQDNVNNVRNKARERLRELYPERYKELLPVLRDKITREFVEPWKQEKGSAAERRQWLEQLYDGTFYAELAGEAPTVSADSTNEQGGPDNESPTTDSGSAEQEQARSEFPVRAEDMDDFYSGQRAEQARINEEFGDTRFGREVIAQQRQRQEERAARKRASRESGTSRPATENRPSAEAQTPLRVEPISLKELSPNQVDRRNEFSQNERPSTEEARGIEIYLKRALNFMPLSNPAKNSLRPDFDRQVEQFVAAWQAGNTTAEDRESRMNEIFSGELVNNLIRERQAEGLISADSITTYSTEEVPSPEQQGPVDGSVQTLERLVKRFSEDRRFNYNPAPLSSLNNERFAQEYTSMVDSHIKEIREGNELTDEQERALQFLTNSYNLFGQNLGARTTQLEPQNFEQLQSELSKELADIRSMKSWVASARAEGMTDAEYKAEQVEDIESGILEPLWEKRDNLRELLNQVYADIEGVREQSAQVRPIIENLAGSEALFAKQDEVFERIERVAGELNRQLRDIKAAAIAFERVLEAWKQAA